MAPGGRAVAGVQSIAQHGVDTLPIRSIVRRDNPSGRKSGQADKRLRGAFAETARDRRIRSIPTLADRTHDDLLPIARLAG